MTASRVPGENGKVRACSVGLGIMLVRVSVRDRVGIWVSDGVWVSTFYFC